MLWGSFYAIPAMRARTYIMPPQVRHSIMRQIFSITSNSVGCCLSRSEVSSGSGSSSYISDKYIPDPVASLTECLSSSHPFHLFSLDHRRMILRPFKRLISRLLSGFFSGSKVGPARYSISLSRFTKYLFPHITCGIVPSSTNCLMR